jgi:hypothetical protein
VPDRKESFLAGHENEASTKERDELNSFKFSLKLKQRCKAEKNVASGFSLCKSVPRLAGPGQ